MGDFNTLFLKFGGDLVNQVFAGFDDDFASGVDGISMLQRDIDVVAHLNGLERGVQLVLLFGHVAVGKLLAGEAQKANASQEKYVESSFHG